MFPKFFKNNMRKVRGFLRTKKDKNAGNDQERYRLEREEELRGFDSDVKTRKQEQVLKESGGQDISAI